MLMISLFFDSFLTLPPFLFCVGKKVGSSTVGLYMRRLIRRERWYDKNALNYFRKIYVLDNIKKTKD